MNLSNGLADLSSKLNHAQSTWGFNLQEARQHVETLINSLKQKIRANRSIEQQNRAQINAKIDVCYYFERKNPIFNTFNM